MLFTYVFIWPSNCLGFPYPTQRLGPTIYPISPFSLPESYTQPSFCFFLVWNMLNLFSVHRVGCILCPCSNLLVPVLKDCCVACLWNTRCSCPPQVVSDTSSLFLLTSLALFSFTYGGENLNRLHNLTFIGMNISIWESTICRVNNYTAHNSLLKCNHGLYRHKLANIVLL